MTTWMIAHVWTFIVLESLGFLLPSMRADMGLTPVQEGWLGSSSRFGNLILAIPSGWLLSRFNPKPLTTVTLIAAAVLTFLQGWAPTYLILIIGRMLFSMTVVTREPARPLLVRQWIRPSEIVVVNAAGAAIFGLIGAGLVITPIILAAFDDNWRYTVYVFGGVSVFMALQWMVLGRERKSAEYSSEMEAQEGNPLRSILRYRELWILGIGMVGIGVNFSASGVFWPSFMLDAYGVSLTGTAVLAAIGVVITAIAGVLFGMFVNRTGKRKLVLWLCGIVLTVSSIGVLFTGNYAYLVLLSMARGLAWGFFPIVMTLPFELPGIKPREIAVANSFIQTAIWIGAAIGPALAGAIQEGSDDLRLALLLTSLGSMALSAGALLLPRHWDRRAASTA